VRLVGRDLVGGGYHTDEEVLNALEIANFSDEFQSLPMGLNTLLTQEGTSLSSGQIKQVLIARAVVGKPKILILDEATSVLDSRTQKAVWKNLDQLHCTRIVIAHRLSTIRGADRIYVMEKGKIIQAGDYQTLLQKKQRFSHTVFLD